MSATSQTPTDLFSQLTAEIRQMKVIRELQNDGETVYRVIAR